MVWTGAQWGAPLLPGDPGQVGPYRLIARLGAGSMGCVYLAQSRSGLLVAVKTVQADLLAHPRFRRRFAREVAAAGRVSGVFTAAVVDADADAPVPWLATAFIPAPSLHHLVRAVGPLPARAVWWLAAGIAEALESIHAARLVHRDLKPSNVLVAADNPKVIDFGIARAVDGTHNPTQSIIGTPAYMPPEQAVDDPSVTAAGDVYGLGATMLFAATGHAPYGGDTPINVIARLLTAPPNLDGLPGELIDAVAWCLHRDPTLRPAPDVLLTMFEEHIGGTQDAYGAQDWLSPAAFAVVRDYARQSAWELESATVGAAPHGQSSATASSRHGHPATAQFPTPSSEPSLSPPREPTPSDGEPSSRARRMIPLALALIVLTGLVAWGIETLATGRSDSSARRTGPHSRSRSSYPPSSPSPTSSAATKSRDDGVSAQPRRSASSSGSPTMTTSDRPARPDAPVDSTNILIKNWATKRCVDVPGFGYGSVDGQVNQYICNGGTGDNQLWDLELRGDGPGGSNLYLIRNVKDGYCLDLPYYGAQPSATKVSEYYCNRTTADNQLWWLEERSDGIYWIRNYASNHLCLNVDGHQSTVNDLPLTISTCTDTDDQWWYFRSH